MMFENVQSPWTSAKRPHSRARSLSANSATWKNTFLHGLPFTTMHSLPANGTRYIMDDTQAEISAGNSRFRESISTSWDDSYQMIINPKNKCTVEYSSKEPWPIGSYSIYLYIPESKGGLDAEIQVHTDNTLLETVSGASEVKMHIPTGGSWVLVGQYNTDRYYERPVKFKVTISIPENQSGEYPVDAVAFIHQPFSN